MFCAMKMIFLSMECICCSNLFFWQDQAPKNLTDYSVMGCIKLFNTFFLFRNILSICDLNFLAQVALVQIADRVLSAVGTTTLLILVAAVTAGWLNHSDSPTRRTR
jgi:hypothetical protein